MREERFQLDKAKLKEAVWVIASHCPPSELGNVKLHKILYFADMLTFINEGRPMTGVEYLKQKFGPTARHLSSAVWDLEQEGRLKVETVDYYGMAKKNYLTSGEPHRGLLTDQELTLLREAADFVRGVSAREISEISHKAAWEAADYGEVIPYSSALSLLPVEIRDTDREWAKESAVKYANQAPPP